MDMGFYEETSPELLKKVEQMFIDGNSFLTIAEELEISEEEVMDILTEACCLP